MKLKPLGHLCVFLLLLSASAACASAQECLSYEPASVALTGTISRKTFPGPPNYESIRKGDMAETSWVLHLATPICTIASSENDAERGVTDLQLVLTPRQYSTYKRFVGRKFRLKVTGKLTHAITGHHHTPVLLDVAEISRGG